MKNRGSARTWFVFILTTMVCLCAFQFSAVAQTDDEDDPIKLFERAQNAHGKGELEKALELYEAAIKIRPEFPEAEFQRANLLVSLNRLSDAEAGFRKTIELRKNWSLPYAAIGSLMIKLKRDTEAESFLRQALKLDNNNSLAIQSLAEIRFRSGDPKEALSLVQRITNKPDAPLSTWFLRALAERATGDTAAALVSLNHILQSEPMTLAALLERAELLIVGDNKPQALTDLRNAESLIKDDKKAASRVVAAYELAGNSADGQRVAQASGLTSIEASTAGGNKVVGTPQEIEAANSSDPEVSRAAIETLLKKNPGNAMLLARLGDSYRKSDPPRALTYYQQAVEREPRNADYAIGYAAVLVQVRRFAEAATILRRVIAVAPDNYVAHANLATALYSLKQYADALTEYRWLLNAKPDLLIAHYFIATAHDFLGEYVQALTSYETFMAQADPATNQFEIERVKLRLPMLRRQIQLGQGVKQKPADKRKQ